MAKSKIYEWALQSLSSEVSKQFPEWALQLRRAYLANTLPEKKRSLLEQLPGWAEFTAVIKVYICQQSPYSQSYIKERRWYKKPCTVMYAEARRRLERRETGILTDAQAQELLNEAAQIPPTEAWIKSHPGYVYGYHKSDLGIVIWHKASCWVFHPHQQYNAEEWAGPYCANTYRGDVLPRPLLFEPHPAWFAHIPNNLQQARRAQRIHYLKELAEIRAAERAMELWNITLTPCCWINGQWTVDLQFLAQKEQEKAAKYAEWKKLFTGQLFEDERAAVQRKLAEIRKR